VIIIIEDIKVIKIQSIEFVSGFSSEEIAFPLIALNCLTPRLTIKKTKRIIINASNKIEIISKVLLDFIFINKEVYFDF
jgi:hypothetical protein